MPSPFSDMDPFIEKNPIVHELHTQMLAKAQIPGVLMQFC